MAKSFQARLEQSKRDRSERQTYHGWYRGFVVVTRDSREMISPSCRSEAIRKACEAMSKAMHSTIDEDAARQWSERAFQNIELNGEEVRGWLPLIFEGKKVQVRISPRKRDDLS